jgi:predicted nucleic acid-binding protein
VKRYVHEAGAHRVRRWLASATPATSRLSEVELVAALTRRWREGAFSEGERDRALSALASDLAALTVVEIVPAVAQSARELLIRHVLRAGDAVQLASCLHLREAVGEAVAFAGFDGRLNGAAAKEGLRLLR